MANKIDTDLVLNKIEFFMKGKGIINITTTLTECCNFIDFLNENPVFNRFDRVEKDKFNNKYYIFDDIEKRKTISININEIKMFSMPYCNDKENRDDLSRYQIMEWRNKR